MSRQRKYTVNDNFFSSWSINMAYILGFFAADGCIVTRSNRQNSIPCFYISLSEKDICVLENINNMMDSNHPIKSYRSSNKSISASDRVVLSIYSKKIIEDITSLGLKPRKTKDLKWISSCPIEFSSHLTRGYFDGDGSMYETKKEEHRNQYLRCSIYGTYDFLSGVVKYSNIHKSINKHKSIFNIAYTNQQAISMCRWIYNDSCDINRLDRKYQLFNKYNN